MTNLTKFYILALLSEKPRHGYDIMREIGNAIGKKPSAGQIYPLLQNMREKKLVKVSIQDRKKIYVLTTEGKSFAKSMINHFSELVKIAIRQKLKKCAHCGCEIYSGIFRKGGKSFCCKNCAKSYKNSSSKRS